MNFSTRLSLLTLLLMVTIGFASCSSNTAILSDSVSEQSKASLFENQEIYKIKEHPELLDLLGKSVAVFSVFSDKKTPTETAQELHSLVLAKIEEKPVFPSVLDDKSLNSLLTQNKVLAQKKEIYLDSLTAVSVSDRDISNPLGAHLDVENFLVYQLDQWPIQSGDAPAGFRMKLRVVDAKTGLIIWTAIAESRKLSAEEISDPAAAVKAVAGQLTDNFYNVFKKKWHRKRFEGLQNS